MKIENSLDYISAGVMALIAATPNVVTFIYILGYICHDRNEGVIYIAFFASGLWVVMSLPLGIFVVRHKYHLLKEKHIYKRVLMAIYIFLFIPPLVLFDICVALDDALNLLIYR